MSYSRNYINGIPSSVIGYGTSRQTFQSYDGIFTGAGTEYDITLNTLQNELNALDERMDAVDATLAALGLSGSGGTSTVSTSTIICDTLEATNALIGSDTVSGMKVTNNLTMDSKPLYLAAGGDAKSKIQAINAGIVGHGSETMTDIRGQRGGALCSGSSRDVCLDFCAGKIRALKTFQAGLYTTNGSETGTITFGVPFLSTPTVVTHVYGTDSGSYYVMRVNNITVNGFDWKKYRIDSNGLYYNAVDEDFGWVAFDPTNTNIFA
jgi:hypothetical protein